MVEQQFGALGHRFIGQPTLKQMFLEDVAFFGEFLLCPVGKNDPDAFDIECFHVVRNRQAEVLNGQFRQALATMHRRTHFRIRFQNHR